MQSEIVGWNHEYKQVNNLKLHYVKEGIGETLVILLHGWPEFWYSWKNQITALKEDYTVVAPDLRGFNLSDKPKQVSDYEQGEVAKDIVVLIGELGFSKAVIVGHDWGGAIAWHLAINYPDLVEKLVVLNCPHPGIIIKNFKSNPLQILKSSYMFFFQLPFLPEWVMNLNMMKFFQTVFRGWALNKENFPDQVLQHYVNAYHQKGAMTGGFNYYRANIRAIRKVASGNRRKVQADTLIIWGEGDKVLGSELLDGSADYIEGKLSIHRIPKCSHWVQNDCPEEVNHALLNFLN